MNDFKKLREPAESSKGWYIAIDELSAGWLATHGVIAIPNGTSLDIYYSTELEAYEAQYAYYKKHRKYYPYGPALNAVRQAAGTVPKIINGSQTMEFI